MWLPDVGETVAITGGPWDMRLSGGPGKRVACLGEGMGDTLDFTIDITRITDSGRRACLSIQNVDGL